MSKTELLASNTIYWLGLANEVYFVSFFNNMSVLVFLFDNKVWYVYLYSYGLVGLVGQVCLVRLGLTCLVLHDVLLLVGLFCFE